MCLTQELNLCCHCRQHREKKFACVPMTNAKYNKVWHKNEFFHQQGVFPKSY